MKHIFKTLLLATLFIQGTYAASCNVDYTQMRDQISKYQSIYTKGCPLNAYNWGITEVLNVTDKGSEKCSAVCFYARGPGSQGKKCDWEKGSWGDTLTCS